MTADTNQIIQSLTEHAKTDPDIRGLYLAGSHGTGTADAFSDIDFVALVAPDTDAAVADNWRMAVEHICTVVFWNRQGFGNVLLNAITEDWTRIDLITNAYKAFAQRAQSDLRALYDPEKRLVSLPPNPPDPQVNPAQITRITSEFLRVMGLLHVVLGRNELVTGVWGAGLQRDHIAALLTLRDGIRNSGGALHQSKTLSPGSMTLLQSLPYPGPNRADLLAAHSALAKVFFPLARDMAAKHNAEWPDAFEAATKDRLNLSFGSDFDTNW